MAKNSQLYPPFEGVNFKVKNITADDSEGTINTVPAGVVSVMVVGITNDSDDYIVLPKLEDVQDGHEINIQCGASSNFGMRTPHTSDEEINSYNCDGAYEYLCTDTEVLKVIKIDNTIGWMAHAYSAIGAVVTAVVPDLESSSSSSSSFSSSSCSSSFSSCSSSFSSSSFSSSSSSFSSSSSSTSA